MNKLLILIALMLSTSLSAQQIDRVYKENGVWKGDLSQPVQKYPIKGAIIADTSAIPDPPTTPPIPPVNTTSIDNVDSKIVYSGTDWYNGSTNAEGFYPAAPNSTIAYNSIAGRTATLIFVGTSIEVFCEKKAGVGHGSASFQIDSQAPTTVALGVTGPVGSTSVFKVENLSNVQHTFKLTVVGGGNVVFDYVRIVGTAVTPPIPPQPPQGDIIVQPGQSIKATVESAASGKTVSILAGTYNEPNINVPAGVNIIGSGAVTIVSTTYGAAGSAETALFVLNSSSTNTTGQTISNLTLEGNNVGYGGIWVNNRTKVFIDKVNFKNFNFHGLWLKSVKDSQVSNCDFYNTAWAGTGYSSGQINIFALTNVTIGPNNTIRTDRDKKGTGIEALWKESVMTNLKILNNRFALDHRNPWNNYQAKNFSIEIHDTHYNGIEIAYNDFGNQLSMASHKPATPSTPGKTIIHDNTGNLGGDTMFVENISDNMDIYNNVISGAAMFVANFQPNSVWKNHNYYNNNFSSSGPVSWGGIILIGPMGVQNFIVRDNTFKMSGNVFIRYMGTTGGVTDTNNIKNP